MGIGTPAAAAIAELGTAMFSGSHVPYGVGLPPREAAGGTAVPIGICTSGMCMAGLNWPFSGVVGMGTPICESWLALPLEYE